MTNSARQRSNNQTSIFFLLGLVLTAGTAIWFDSWGRALFFSQPTKIDLAETVGPFPVAPRALTKADIHAAEVAWRYFEKNTQPGTGMVDSVAGFPSATLWDQGSYLLALLSAEKLSIISRSELDDRVDQFLQSMNGLPLFENILPNKVYHTQTLEMVDYENTPVPEGIGWSALDVARLLSALRVLERRAPGKGEQIRNLLAKWNLNALVHEGELTGTQRINGETLYLQEGRIGYEQYAARAAALWGLDAISAISAQRILAWESINSVSVPVDQRTFSAFKAITPTLSEPYFLQGLELGLDSEGKQLAARVYRAQENRYNQSGITTMVSEDHVSVAPYFLYSSVYSNGGDWAVVSEKGENYPELRTISLKAAFAWDALYAQPYTQFVRNQFVDLETENGWPAGIYEKDKMINTALTLNTNAVVLEAIHYIAHGPLWQVK